MSAYYWYLITYEFDDYPVTLEVDVAGMSEREAVADAENVLYDMGVRARVRNYLVDRQDPVEVNAT